MTTTSSPRPPRTLLHHLRAVLELRDRARTAATDWPHDATAQATHATGEAALQETIRQLLAAAPGAGPAGPMRSHSDIQSLLEIRDRALAEFEAHPESYGAMAAWELRDDDLHAALRRLLEAVPIETAERLVPNPADVAAE